MSRGSWIRLRAGVLSWHSNSRCPLLMLLSLVPICVFRLFRFSFCTARHLFVRALFFWSLFFSSLVAWGVLVSNRFRSRSSLTICSILVAHFSACHPSCIRSRIYSSYFWSRFAKGRGLSVITSWNNSRMYVLFPKIVFFVVFLLKKKDCIFCCIFEKIWLYFC
jgi:hypothetical protein